MLLFVEKKIDITAVEDVFILIFLRGQFLHNGFEPTAYFVDFCGITGTALAQFFEHDP